MSDFHFFTTQDSITELQQSDFAFGEISDENNFDRYNLENKFRVTENAPAFAMCKSLVLMSLDSIDPSLLNIALMPLDNYGGGIPIKFIIYRGINKSLLYDSNGFINQPDNTWKENNILKVIHELQSKINTDTGANDNPTTECLGIQFDSLPSETLLEHVFSDDLDSFHPLIVETGCQVGKFSGNTKPAGIEIIIDKVGYDATLEVLRLNSHIFQIEKLVIDNGLSEEEKLKAKFTNRILKEEILAYIDITALYGSCINQGIKIKGTDDPNFLSFFANKNSIYIDIRDKRGFSFNHFFETSDVLKIGLKESTNDNPIFVDYNYYNSWPILKLNNLNYTSEEQKFYLKIPIRSTDHLKTSILSSYSGRIASDTGNTTNEYYIKLKTVDKSGNVLINYSEDVQLKNWKFSNNKLGCNYFLLKYDVVENTNPEDVLSPIWESFFSLKMIPFQGLDDISEGEIRVRTYSSVNSPLLIDNGKNRIFTSQAGIVVDKHHISFFVFYKDTADNGYAEQNGNFPEQYLSSGKYKFYFDPEEFDYESHIDQSVGFLYYMTKLKNKGVKDYELKKYVFDDVNNELNQKKFLRYVKAGNKEKKDLFFDNFEVITLSHSEYIALLNAANSIPSPAQEHYIFDHPLFLRSKRIIKYDYPRFSFIQNSVTLAIPKVEIIEQENIVYINMVEYPEDIKINDEEIIMHSVILN